MAVWLILSELRIGFILLLLGFVLIHVFMSKKYKSHPKYESLDIVIDHYSSKVKSAVTEKASEIQEKTNQAKSSHSDEK